MQAEQCESKLWGWDLWILEPGSLFISNISFASRSPTAIRSPRRSQAHVSIQDCRRYVAPGLAQK